MVSTSVVSWTFAGVSYDTVLAEVDKDTAENMASAMRAILAFSRAKEGLIREIQKDLDKKGEVAGQAGEKQLFKAQTLDQSCIT